MLKITATDVSKVLRQTVRKIVNTMGYEITPIIPPDMEETFLSVYRECKNYTTSSIERMYALYKATQYVVSNRIQGDIVECGVYKGGSSMICALTLKMLKETQRNIYLYDTYAGMPAPTEKDIDYKGEKAIDQWNRLQKSSSNKWRFASLLEVCDIEDVKNAMYLTKYPREHLLFVKGKVEDTVPNTIPEKVALLRLDTVWYESTYHELKHLLPRLSPNGVLILDDYGHQRGVREAVDKYIRENAVEILLNRIDYTGRIGIKVSNEK